MYKISIFIYFDNKDYSEFIYFTKVESSKCGITIYLKKIIGDEHFT